MRRSSAISIRVLVKSGYFIFRQSSVVGGRCLLVEGLFYCAPKQQDLALLSAWIAKTGKTPNRPSKNALIP
jgi:hypothetical protein